MKVTLLMYWDKSAGSFWFVPAIMAGAAIALAHGAIALDGAATGGWVRAQSWAYTGSAEGASAMLETIAGSMITIAGVVFSMTLVTLSLASSQLGPRLLRSFMTDKTTQVVLGTFVATLLYSLFVLRAIRRVEENLFVPHLSVAFGVLFAVTSLGVLVYFIHHVALSIQADHVVARVGVELTERIDRLFPESIGERSHVHADLPEESARDACPIGAVEDGYVQLIDSDALLGLAVEEDLILRVVRRPGQFAVKASPLALAWPGRRVHAKTEARVNEAFVLGSQRTPVRIGKFDRGRGRMR